MQVEIKKDERIDDLQYKGLKIIQDKNGFCFGIDSIILSDFIENVKKENNIVDLGAGTGILGILLSKKTLAKEIIGIEIQSDVAEMAERSIKLNNLQEKVKIINEDIKNIIPNKIINKNSVDIIVSNPPYKDKKDGGLNENEKKLISRHETTATLSDFIEIASKLLKDKGIFYMVHKPERLVDIIYLLRENKIEPKEIEIIYPSKGKEASLILIKGIKGARKFLKVRKAIYVYDEQGNYTEDITKIYNIKKKEEN